MGHIVVGARRGALALLGDDGVGQFHAEGTVGFGLDNGVEDGLFAHEDGVATPPSPVPTAARHAHHHLAVAHGQTGVGLGLTRHHHRLVEVEALVDGHRHREGGRLVLAHLHIVVGQRAVANGADHGETIGAVEAVGGDVKLALDAAIDVRNQLLLGHVLAIGIAQPHLYRLVGEHAARRGIDIKQDGGIMDFLAGAIDGQVGKYLGIVAQGVVLAVSINRHGWAIAVVAAQHRHARAVAASRAVDGIDGDAVGTRGCGLLAVLIDEDDTRLRLSGVGIHGNEFHGSLLLVGSRSHHIGEHVGNNHLLVLAGLCLDDLLAGVLVARHHDVAAIGQRRQRHLVLGLKGHRALLVITIDGMNGKHTRVKRRLAAVVVAGHRVGLAIYHHLIVIDIAQL